MLTGIAAVPASTSRSPQLSVTIYRPNQSNPEPGIPGQAARAGQPPSLSSHHAEGEQGHKQVPGRQAETQAGAEIEL